MFSRITLFCTILSLTLYSAIALGMSTQRSDFIELLKTLKDSSVIDVTQNIISSETIINIKKSWYALVIAENGKLKEDRKFDCIESEKFLEIEEEDLKKENGKFKRDVYNALHPDKWGTLGILDKNKEIVEDLRNVIMTAKHTDNSDIVLEKQLFQVLIDLEKLHQHAMRGSSISQSDLNNLGILWDTIDFDKLYDTGVGSVFAQIDRCCRQNWGSNENAAASLIEKLSSAIKSVSPQNRIILYLEQLKKADASEKIHTREIATIKKLWYKIGSFCGILSLAGMDQSFQDSIRDICAQDKWKDRNKKRIGELCDFLNSNDSVQKMKELHEKQNLLIEKLKVFKTTDQNDENTAEINSSLDEIRVAWQAVQSATGTNNVYKMDEDFYIAVKSQLFLETWQHKNRVKLAAAIFKDKFFDRLAADLSSIDYRSLSFSQKAKVTIRSLIDPNYSADQPGPKIFVEMLEKRLTTLKKSSLSSETVQEIKGLCEILLSYKAHYNYSLLDHILYPFHTSIPGMMQGLKISSDDQLNTQFNEKQKTDCLESKIISQEITRFKTNLFERPKKSVDGVVDKVTDVLQFGAQYSILALMNKVVPSVFKDKETELYLSFIKANDNAAKHKSIDSKHSAAIAEQKLRTQIYKLKSVLHFS